MKISEIKKELEKIAKKFTYKKRLKVGVMLRTHYEKICYSK